MNPSEYYTDEKMQELKRNVFITEIKYRGECEAADILHNYIDWRYEKLQQRIQRIKKEADE
jgi:hypothetical protein